MTAKWPLVSLAELVRLERRPVELKPEQKYQEIGIYCFGRGIFHKTPRTGLEIGDKNLYELQDGDLILQVTFAWEGAIALCSKAEHGLYGSTRYPTFRVDETRCFAPFLLRYLGTPGGLEQINKICPGSAGRNRVLSLKRIHEVMVPLPPLPEQRRIVARIEELAAKINQARGLREQQKLDVQQLLLSVFWKISKTAPRMPMDDVAPLVRRPVEVDLEGSYPEMGIRSFGNGTFHKPALSGSEVGSKRIFKIEPGDLVFSNVFAWEGAIAVARSEDVGRFGSHRFMTCVPKKQKATSRFLCFYFLTDEGLEMIGAASPGGAGRNRTLGLEALANIYVPIPSLEAQRWFDSLLTSVAKLKEQQAEATAELDALLPSILDKAFRGEL